LYLEFVSDLELRISDFMLTDKALCDKNLSSVVRLLSSVVSPPPSTSVENPLQIDLFMQNKPNFQKSQIHLNAYTKTAYENKSNWTLGENKPNSNPIKACPELAEALSAAEGAVEWANFFKGQNERKIGCIHISKKYNVLIGRFWVVKQTLL